MNGLIDALMAAGVSGAELMDSRDIVLSADFRDICKGNACGEYGRCWTCPPFIGEIDALMAEVRAFSRAALYQSIHAIEDSFDIEGMLEAGKKHRRLSVDIESWLKASAGRPYLHLSCGGCGLCESCAAIAGQPCRHPELTLPSMEGYGIDVYNTGKATGLKYINGVNTVTYFGIVLYNA